MPHESRIVDIIRERQKAMRREMDRRGIAMKAVSMDSGIGYDALLTYFPADALKVPTSALFRRGDQWAAYVVSENLARERQLKLDHRTGQEAEVVDGLNEGDVVVLHPADTLADDARVVTSTNGR